jgi:uncharacterized protein YpmS
MREGFVFILFSIGLVFAIFVVGFIMGSSSSQELSDANTQTLTHQLTTERALNHRLVETNTRLQNENLLMRGKVADCDCN